MRHIYALILSATASTASAASHLPTDSLQSVSLDDVVITASTKETEQLDKQPLSVSSLTGKVLEQRHTTSVKQLSGYVPNFFMPDYGSHLTSAIYIRGIGSRINTPAVGLYVDGVPMMEKAGFDNDLLGIEHIDVLRGPQGTLYGNNTMGGVLCLQTADPMLTQGTTAKLSATTRGHLRASLLHMGKMNERLAYSAGAFYDDARGVFKNTLTGKRQDEGQQAGGKLRLKWRATDRFTLDANALYQYTDEGAYPYFYEGVVNGDEDLTEQKGTICQNRKSGYRRNLLLTSARAQYFFDHSVWNATTSFQWVDDKMTLDQDCLPGDYFTMKQLQNSKVFTEEWNWKSTTNTKWKWSNGAFFAYQWMDTKAPVGFEKDGIGMIQSSINTAMNSSMPPTMSANMALTNEQLRIPGSYNMPTMTAAIFHQSTLNLDSHWAITAGLRLAYEKRWIDYDTSTDSLAYTMTMSMMPRPIPGKIPSLRYVGHTQDDNWQLLPKLAVSYTTDSHQQLYATVSKGYRSGGYNIQMFSDFFQTAYRSKDVKDYRTTEDFMAKTDVEALNKAIRYEPETSWNYELGTRLNLFNNRLTAHAAAFYVDTHNQQVAQFAGANGLGRTMENAGRGESYGAEIDLAANWWNGQLTTTASYGWTHATFRNYTDHYEDAEGFTQEISYKGKYVPFAPQHTFALGAELNRPVRSNIVDRWFAGASVNGAGNIYWNEANSWKEPFYATLQAHAGVQCGAITVDVWGKNLTNTHYNTFGFDNAMTGTNRRFQQHGRPIEVGIDLKVNL